MNLNKEIERQLFNNELEHDQSLLFGYFSTLILSKEFAKQNSDLKEIMNRFSFDFKDYVYKSRTILLSRVIRIIEKKEPEDTRELFIELANYLDSNKTSVPSKKKKATKKEKTNMFDDIFNQLG